VIFTLRLSGIGLTKLQYNMWVIDLGILHSISTALTNTILSCTTKILVYACRHNRRRLLLTYFLLTYNLVCVRNNTTCCDFLCQLMNVLQKKIAIIRVWGLCLPLAFAFPVYIVNNINTRGGIKNVNKSTSKHCKYS
jgi:hypothetical protein